MDLRWWVMDNLSKEARLIEEIVRRVLTRYQAHLHTEDYQRRALQVAIDDLPNIVAGALASVQEQTADPDAPCPHDLMLATRSARFRR